MFCDLNQLWTGGSIDDKERLIEALKLGFSCVALNYVVQTKQELLAPCPIEVLDLDGMIQISDLDRERSARLLTPPQAIQQLKRVTLRTDNPDEAQVLLQTFKNRKLLKYDLVACCPLSAETLKWACETMEVDIVSLDPACPSITHLKQSLLKTAIARGVTLEVGSMSLSVVRQKQNFIQFLNKYSKMTRAKSTVVSSGASEAKFLRSPYDVIHLLCYLGFSQTQAERCVSIGGAEVVKRAAERRYKAQRHYLPPPLPQLREAKKPKLSETQRGTPKESS